MKKQPPDRAAETIVFWFNSLSSIINTLFLRMEKIFDMIWANCINFDTINKN